MSEPFSREFWDERYASRTRLWSGEPNRHLVAQASDLAPGRALDVGCGEGADALWLAARGWAVTGVDVSIVALERAAGHGAEAGLTVDWREVDGQVWGPEPEAFDLVTAQFLHLPSATRGPLHARLAAGVAPGGTLLVVGHHPSDLATTVGRPPLPDLLFTAEDVAATLDPAAWEVTVAAAEPRPATDRDGATVTVHDAVLRARRR